MRIALAGGSGLLGAALARRLRDSGHEVVFLVRRREGAGDVPPAIEFDFTAPPASSALAPRLRGVDALVNTVGIFQEAGKQTFDALHVKGPRRLFEAAMAAGVPRLLQVSALGARPDAAEAYFASKARADAEVLALPVSAVVVRPSLVFSPQGASTRQFARWAGWPITPLPGDGAQPVQPIHLDDLVSLLVALLAQNAACGVVPAVGPRALPLREYLGLFRQALGKRARFLEIPRRVIRGLGAIASRLSGGLANAEALSMLDASQPRDPDETARLLGRAPRDPVDFFERPTQIELRHHVQLSRATWLLRASLAVLWLGTAWVSLWWYPRAASHAMLAQLGLHGAAAELALWSGALLDAAFGAGLLLLRRRSWLYLAQIMLVCGYTLLITVGLPEQWAHPFGPVLKNIPLLALTYVLYRLDRRDGPGTG